MPLLELVFSQNALWALLAILFGAWLVLSWVLRYHWNTYSIHSATTKRATRIYFIVSIFVFLIAIGLILSL